MSDTSTESIEEFWSRLAERTLVLDSRSRGGAAFDRAGPERLARLARGIESRRRDGPESPIRVAFFGPTGAGKSKLFCSLLGRSVSASGFQRPFTRQAFHWVHEDWRTLAATFCGTVEYHRDERWRQFVLIDTPDFDSVESTHRDEAERVYSEADVLLFVVDALKYADAESWIWFERIVTARKPCSIAFNKVRGEHVVADFLERFERTFGKRAEPPLVVVPELAIDDETLIPLEHPTLVELANRVRALAGDPSELIRRNIASFRRDLEELVGLAREERESWEARTNEIVRLRERVKALAEAESAKLGDRPLSTLDPGVRKELESRVLERIERIDVLRHPRRWLAMPVEGLRNLWSRWGGGARTGEAGAVGASDVASESGIPSSEMFQSLEAAVLRLTAAGVEELQSSSAFRDRLGRVEIGRLRLSRDEILAAYREGQAGFRAWAESEARATAAALSSQNKTKFILAQILFNSVLVGVQIKSFGAFTLLELGIDGVLSPFLAKIVGLAISSEKVREFEKRAHAEHLRVLGTIVDRARARFDELFDLALIGSSELMSALGAFSAQETRVDALVLDFAGAHRALIESAVPSGGIEEYRP
jgi:hypothetical protein